METAILVLILSTGMRTVPTLKSGMAAGTPRASIAYSDMFIWPKMRSRRFFGRLLEINNRVLSYVPRALAQYSGV